MCGHYEFLAERQDRICAHNPHLEGRIRGHKLYTPSVPVTRITVNLKTGERTVERMQASRKKVEAPALKVPLPALMDKPVGVVLLAVCEAFEVDLMRLLSLRRDNRTAFARYAGYRLLYDPAKRSSGEVGKIFRRDHSTVLSGVKRSYEIEAVNADWVKRFERARRISGETQP